MSTKTERKSLRKILAGRKKSSNEEREDDENGDTTPINGSANSSMASESTSTNLNKLSTSPKREARGRSSTTNADHSNFVQRMRSRSTRRTEKQTAAAEKAKELLVAVTSCRSDGYYNEKAPGSVSKLPRKAPTNLKLFHELAVGVKDAYEAVQATPKKLTEEEKVQLDKDVVQARMVLWDYIGNLDFLLALVDEVSVDTVTRGALKDDATFKGVRDVIKKGNRVLEEMLVRRERKYTLFFRLVQVHDVEQIERMKNWNNKVEKAINSVTGGQTRESYTASSQASSSGDGNTSDSISISSIGSQSMGSVSGRVGVFSRGRQLLPAAGRVRARRATPTPRLRKHKHDGGQGDSAADGFSVVTASSDLSSLSSQNNGGDDSSARLPNAYESTSGSQLKQLQPLEPKDELVDVIRGLRVEKQKNQESTADDELAAIKPNWHAKAEIPSTVPKLSTEYVHRHRLMKQVVSCLLDETDAPSGEDGGSYVNTAITCVTSRHGDKAGNGKSTLAVAVIQTVEVRERFSDGIAWLKLGREQLGERDVRRLYEELYRQLIVKEADFENGSLTQDQSESNYEESMSSLPSAISEARVDRTVEQADSTRRFQGGDLEGIKEDLARMIIKRNILICLDDVWRVEDVKWFLFETPTYSIPLRDSPFKLLITTRIPGLLGNGSIQDVFVRILSEHEAVKLLLSTAGRRPYGGRNSAVFNQSKMIVKGCGNAPLGILLVGSMLRQSSRNWNINSPVWMGVVNQCSLNLEEAAQMRSFKNAFTRIVDMSFLTIDNPRLRVALRRCFVLFSMAFRQNDWMLSGRGIPQSILLKFFETVVSACPASNNGDTVLPESLIEILENLKLIQRARHTVPPRTLRAIGKASDDVSESSQTNVETSEKEESEWDDFDDLPKRKIQQSYTMHDSLKAVAEKMAERDLPYFTPTADEFMFYTDKLTEESEIVSGKPSWISPLRFLVQQLKAEDNEAKLLTDEKVHELVAISLVGGGDGKALSKSSISEAMRVNQISMQQLDGGAKFEEYAMSFLPEHLMHAQAHTSAAELLVDSDFGRRRVFALGITEATARHVADIFDLRADEKKTLAGESLSEKAGKGVSVDGNGFDVDSFVCDASRVVVDEVYKVTNSMGTSDSLGMATCLASVGECLLKCRQPRDAMLRLEEAVSIYRGILGSYHVYVAHALHSVAKALTKLGETRVALLKFAEAARIYETCNATLHYDSIVNAQSLASLLVDIGDIRKAEAMFEEVIAMKQTVYGETSVPVAKTINNYAILLAKHGRMTDALRHYEIARQTYMKTPPSLIIDPEFEIKCNYDVTLITLNIASIYSKKNDLDQALKYYEDGVRGLGQYEDEMAKLREISGTKEPSPTKGSSHKHLVAALGRIGSIKVKKGDHNGALEAYLMLIKEVDDDSPLTSHIEKAKAYIKCATIYRKRGGEENHATAVGNLREALRMYKALYDPKHKDTVAIATTLKQWLAEDKVPE